MIKKIEYDDMQCLAIVDYAVCPYCGYENYIEPDYYLGQDEEEFEVCGECERTFVHQINYTVTFTSEPLENYYLDTKKRKLKRIEYLKEKIKGGEFKETYLAQLGHAKKELEEFEKEMLEMLEVEEA